MTPEFSSLYSQALTAAGLTEDQARIYEILLKRGPRQAGQLPKAVGISRTYVYKLLEDLAEMGLVTKDDPPGAPARFVASHPFAVQELARKRAKEADIASRTIEGVMGSLISDYTTSNHIPGIRVLPELKGVAELYRDLLHVGADVKLIRSTYDDDSPERMDLVLAQIGLQTKHGIHTRLIGPMPTDVSVEELHKRDRARLTTRRIFPREKFSLPAQILMYGNRVALTSYRDTIITSIIENEAISETFGTLFEMMWLSASDPYSSI